MILKYYGHAFWTMTMESGLVVALDPYGDFYQYPKRNIKADFCLISHHHHDHDGLSSLQPGAAVIDECGTHVLNEEVQVLGVASWHDEAEGQKRGSNTIFVVEAEGLRIAHAGDLGHVPTAAQIKALGRIDVLLVPVGGYYTIDAKTALDVCRLIQPRMAIPMHYRTEFDPDMPIGQVSEFLELVRAEDTQMPLVRLTKADLSQRPAVITMKIQ